MSVLVLGGTGTIGTALVKQLLTIGHEVTIFSRDEYKQHKLKLELSGQPVNFIIGDVRSYDSVYNAMAGHKYCFHVAAMKHVSICEENPSEAIQTNVLGTQNIIKAAKSCLVEKVLAISTDKAVYPISVLGATKLLMEKLLTAEKFKPPFVTRFASIRFGNIIESRGSVFEVWKDRVAKDLPLQITNVQATRFFLKIEEAVSKTIEAFMVMNGGETFVIGCGNPKQLKDLALEFCGDNPKPFIVSGLTRGERLHERLSAAEEYLKFTDVNGLWKISDAD